ncbi:MAG: tryptophan-rich sensory protein [Nitrososphaeria archaeon]|nr:tryptophan-rich sensory protein [Nitrososphaeria archaeon]
MKTSGNKSYFSIIRWANVLLFIFTLLVNGLAGGTTFIGGKNTAQVSDSYPTLITPAGYVFSIWGVIYILLGVYVVYQFFAFSLVEKFQRRIGWLFVLSCIFNVIWLFLWQFEYLTLSVILMFLLLATLISIYLRLDIGKSKVSITERLVFHLPFSVYLGWISIASIANVAVTLVSLKWNGFSIDFTVWVTLIIIAVLLITLIMLVTRKDLAYALVVVWALLGISVKQSGNQTVVLLIEICTLIIVLALIAIVLLAFIRGRK